jgi:general secretion pathway protein L
MTSTRLLFMPPEPDAPLEVLDVTGGGVSRWTLAPDERLDGPVTLVVPGAETTARWMDLPTGSPAQARSAVAFRLEDEVALGGGDLHIAVGDVDADGRTLVVWTAREKLQAWLELAAARGATAVAAIPDYLLLPDGQDGELVVAELGERTALREPGGAMTVEPDLAALLIENRPHRLIPAADLDRWLAAGARAPRINLLQGRFGRRDQTTARGPRRLAILAAALVISPLIVLATQIIHDVLTAQAMEKRATALAVSLVPQAARYENAAGYALSRLAAARGGRGFSDLVAVYFTMLQSTPGVRLDSLVYGEEGVIRSTIAYVNASDMDQLRAAAKRLRLELTEQSTVAEGGRITSDLVIRRQP